MIKFRAWYKKNTLPMLSVILISFDQNFIDVYIDKEFQSETEMSFDFDEVILMQSTGLFDINGVEIFEGDVVKIRDSNEIGIVKRDPHEPRLFVDYNKGSKCKLWFMEPVTESFFKVIGNIHENPDLLEVNND